MTYQKNSLSCWIESYVDQAYRKLGRVFVAGNDAPEQIVGKLIFYREFGKESYYIQRTDKSIGFDTKTFEYLESKDVEFVVSFARDTNRMNIAPLFAFDYESNYGCGTQTRARLYATITLNDWHPLRTPNAMPVVRIDSEKPSPKPAKGKDDFFQLVG